MKQYLFFIVCFMSIVCLAPSKKGKVKNRSVIEASNSDLAVKIQKITKLIPLKSFTFDANSNKNLYQQYLSWSKKLSKKELLKIIAFQEETSRGFTENDAQQTINALKSKPFSQLHDIFVNYQQEFVAPDHTFEQEQPSDHLLRLHKAYQAEQNNLSYIRRLPLVHNFETTLLPDITKFTDKELYEKIAKEMKRVGFLPQSIEEEIKKLENSSDADLQKDFPHLQKELAHRLVYFNKTKQDSSEQEVKVDKYLNLLHTWTTTIASVAAGSAIFFGASPLALQAVSSSTLLNPYISQYQNFSKRQMLTMIYAQYESFDALQDVYLDPNFKKIALLTKQEILDSMKKNMELMGVSSDLILGQMNKYQNLKKSELEIIAQGLQDLSKKHSELAMSENEKRIEVSTRKDLLHEIQDYVSKLEMSKEEKEDFLKNLTTEDINVLKTTLLDVQEALEKKEKRPNNIFSIKEKVLLNSPKIVSDVVAPRALEYIRHDWQTAEKSPAYQYWKENALRRNLEEKQENFLEHHLQKTYEKSSLIRSIIPGS